jgi:AAA domain
LVGIPLRKYSGFQQKLWGELAKPIGAGLSVMVSRGSWRAVLPKAVVETTATYIAQVMQNDVDAVVNGVMENTLRLANQKRDDPDIAFEQFIEGVRASLARKIIGPLLDRMEGFFARTENKPVESLRELEDQLSARLGSGIETSSGAAFSKLLVEGSSESLRRLLRDQLEINLIRRELEAFFATFTTADLYVDLSDLVRSSRLVENADFYMHIGEVHYAGHVFPIFYIPFTAERTEQGFQINSASRLYVNKRAMDYVAQEVAKAEGRATIPSMLRERIFYLSAEQSALGEAQKIFDDLAGSFNLRAEIDFKAPRDQKVSSLHVTATNRLSFSLFDRSDESMVNDYEALLTGIEAGDSVVGFFESLIDEFLLKNPISVRADVDSEWAQMPMPQRLVFDSPLPLVEEQRKVLSAIKHSKSRFIAVEGPPGTGKSHTITAVAFDLILAGKNLLVLSDKKEALDVVEDKLNQALTKVRPSEDFPNPILRLGMDASNYGQLLKKSAIERLQVNQRVVRKGRPEREKALVNERAQLVKGLEKAAGMYAEIDIARIAELERDTADLAGKNPHAAAILADQRLSELVDNFGVVSEHLRSHAPLAAILRWQGPDPGCLNEISRLATALSSFPAGSMDLGPIIAFSSARLGALEGQIKAIEDSKNAVFGYLLARKKLREIARKLQEECGLESEYPHRDLPKLKLWRNNLYKNSRFSRRHAP